ncbi:MAG: hypothetical protein RUMPE_01070 [Eubacteriales bacterium SKADARSKE-1]|nr:hypothetical protein [Eubacteriales bacterium SKADARSKE-1]
MTNYDLLEDFDDEEILEEKVALNPKEKRYKAKHFILLVQIIVSILIILSALVVEYSKLDYLEPIKSWYLQKINDSLIAGDDIENYKQVFKQNISLKRSFEKETPCQNTIAEINPVDLSVVLTKPLSAGTITSRFGTRVDPITKKDKNHYGLDISANKGDAIYAVLPGMVKKAEKFGSYGNCVIVDHGNNIETLYAHCAALKVNPSEIVKRGQELALVGNSGRSTGSHLHFELLINGVQYDPEQFFKGNYIC